MKAILVFIECSLPSPTIQCNQVRVWAGKSEPECALGTLASSGYGREFLQTRRAGHVSVAGATRGDCGSGEADVQDEVAEVQVQ